MSSPDTHATSSLSLYFRLLGYVKPYAGLFATSILGYVIFASSQPMLAAVLKYFVDGLVDPQAATLGNIPLLRGLQMMHAVPLLVVLIALWQGIGSYLGNYFLARVSMGVVHDLRVALFNSLLTLPDRYFDQNNSGHLISRITFNVTMVTGAATDAIKVVIREGLTVIFLFAYLLWANWKLTLVMVAILPVIGLMVVTASRKFRKQAKKIQVAMGDVTHVASETIQGHRVVRSFGGESYEQQPLPRGQPQQHGPAAAHGAHRRDLHAPAAAADLQRHGRAVLPGAVAARRRLAGRPGRLHHRGRAAAQADPPALGSQLDDPEGRGGGREHLRAARRAARNRYRHGEPRARRAAGSRCASCPSRYPGGERRGARRHQLSPSSRDRWWRWSGVPAAASPRWPT
jgi:ABC-type multidrug transport system fused ATPase/permease subunit